MFVKFKGIVLLCHTERVDDPCILDLAFILDASGSITNAWPNVRRFVAGVVDLVNVSTAGTHVGMVQFGSESKIVLGFNEGQDKDAVIRKALSLSPPIQFDNTQLHKGLDDANGELFNEEDNDYGYRPEKDVRKVSQTRCLDFRSKPDMSRRSSGASKFSFGPERFQTWPGPSLVWTQSGLDPIWSGPNLAWTQSGLEQIWSGPNLIWTQSDPDQIWPGPNLD